MQVGLEHSRLVRAPKQKVYDWCTDLETDRSLSGRIIRRSMLVSKGSTEVIYEGKGECSACHEKIGLSSRLLPPNKWITGYHSSKVGFLAEAPQRLRILASLAEGEKSLKMLTHSTEIYGAVLWLRVRELQRKGQVRAKRIERRVVYRITPSGMTELKRKYPEIYAKEGKLFDNL